jgi:hypothetical protein
MSVLEIENELRQMSNSERLFVIEIATDLIRKNLSEKNLPKKLSLEESAELMRDEYLNNRELTIVTDSLASEDFYNV